MSYNNISKELPLSYKKSIVKKRLQFNMNTIMSTIKILQINHILALNNVWGFDLQLENKPRTKVRNVLI